MLRGDFIMLILRTVSQVWLEMFLDVEVMGISRFLDMVFIRKIQAECHRYFCWTFLLHRVSDVQARSQVTIRRLNKTAYNRMPYSFPLIVQGKLQVPRKRLTRYT
jgi:hypothetical protein